MKSTSLFLSIMLTSFFFVSCEDNDELLTDNNDDSQYDAEVLIQEGQTIDETIYVDDLEQGQDSVKVAVTFTSEEENMKRLYMTENIAGAGNEIYELDMDLDTKGDGSLDLTNDQSNEFTFVIPFPVLSEMEDGTVEYRLWTTHGRGDFRDSEKRLVGGPGTITVDYGGTNPETADVKEYTAKLLYAPLGDGSSETFISLIDGETYELNDDEYTNYWDFGYYYGGNDEASLASPSAYPALFDHDNDENTALVAIPGLTDTPVEELNNCYFATSSMDFGSISNASDLDGIEKSSNEAISHLSEGDIIEFVDNYGKKGLIEVVTIEGTWDQGDYIELDIKVQP